jgi:hypothetical protein
MNLYVTRDYSRDLLHRLEGASTSALVELGVLLPSAATVGAEVAAFGVSEALVLWLEDAWGSLWSAGADFLVAAGNNALSGAWVWSSDLDALKLVHSGLVLSNLLLNGGSVLSGVGGGTDGSDLGSEGGAFWVFVSSFLWGGGSLGAFEGVQLSLVLVGLGLKLLLVSDGQSGNSDLSADGSALWIFGFSVDWSDDSLAFEGDQTFTVFLDLLLDCGSLAWLGGGTEDSDLSSDGLAFWVFFAAWGSDSVDAFEGVHSGLVFGDLLLDGGLVGGGGGGSEGSDLGSEGVAFLVFVLTAWELSSSLDALEGI